MADFPQFGGNKPTASSGPLDCAMVEQWLTEAAEEILPPTQAEQLQQHAKGCAACSEKLAQMRRGRDWLLMLKEETLHPPSDLVAKIIAKTFGAPEQASSVRDTVVWDGASSLPHTGQREGKDRETKVAYPEWDKASQESSSFPATPGRFSGTPGTSIPVWQRSSLAALRRNLTEPRLALVGAMAFFSITLTLNLMGVRITNLRAADLQPQSVRRSVTRQYAEANAHVVRYYENLRIVYEVESRVQQLRRAADTDAQPEQPGNNQSKGKSGANHSQNGSNSQSDSSDSKESHRDRMAINPHSRQPQRAVPVEPQPILTGPVMDAAFHPQPSSIEGAGMGHVWPRQALAGSTTSFLPFLSFPYRLQLAPQASSCPLRTTRYSMRERRLA